MDPTRITDADALTLARSIRSGEVDAVEAFDAVAARIAQLNPALNAIVRFDAERGRAEARQAQQRLQQGDPAPLLGVPFTVKDNLWVEGQVVSQGSRRFERFVAPQDAFAVQRLRQAGAVFAGVTNCSEFACKGVTTNRLFGATLNPLRPDAHARRLVGRRCRGGGCRPGADRADHRRRRLDAPPCGARGRRRHEAQRRPRAAPDRLRRTGVRQRRDRADGAPRRRRGGDARRHRRAVAGRPARPAGRAVERRRRDPRAPAGRTASRRSARASAWTCRSTTRWSPASSRPSIACSAPVTASCAPTRSGHRASTTALRWYYSNPGSQRCHGRWPRCSAGGSTSARHRAADRSRTAP